MNNRIACTTALGVAMIGGATAANAQSVLSYEPSDRPIPVIVGDASRDLVLSRDTALVPNQWVQVPAQVPVPAQVLAPPAGGAAQPIVAEPVVTQPVPVQTTETIQTVEEPRRPAVYRHSRRAGAARSVTRTTTRTITQQVMPPVAPAVAPAMAPQAPPAVALAATANAVPVVVTDPAYVEVPYSGSPYLYDIAAAVVSAPYAGVLAPREFTPVAQPTGLPYRYVYQTDRILVVDPYTNLAVKVIPR